MTSRTFYPKAGRCRGCEKLHDDCSALPFNTMPIHRQDAQDTVVICTEFRQTNHGASLKEQTRGRR